MAALKQEVLKLLKEGAQRFEREMLTKHLTGPTGPTSLSVQSGDLRRTLTAGVASFGQNQVRMFAIIGTGLPYAKIHEYGGVVTAKNAQYLAIPLPGMGRKNQVSPRQYPGQLVPIRTRFGNLILAEILGKTKSGRQKTRTYKTGAHWTYPGSKVLNKNGELVDLVVEGTAKSTILPVYVLKESVTIPARMQFRETFRAEAANTLGIIRGQLRKLVVKVNTNFIRKYENWKSVDVG